MSRTSFYGKLRELFDEKIAFRLAEAIEEEFLSFDKLATKEDLNEIKETLKELVIFQKNSEIRFEKIEESILKLTEAQKRTEERVNELAEAQKRTEERLGILEQKMAELAEAQRRTEERLGILEEKMARLAEAQEKTELRMNKLEEKMAELAEAQRETEKTVRELSEAQKKTEKRLEKLIGVVEDIKVDVGSISHTVGHSLEDKAILKLPSILKEKFGIELDGELKRGFLENEKGVLEEINVFGFGKKNGERIFIIGEGKARFGKGDLKDFLKKIERFGKIYGKPFPIIITYIFSTKEVEEKVQDLKISYFLSYQLEKL